MLSDVKFTAVEHYHPTDGTYKFIIIVTFDGEPELWGTDDPEKALQELLHYYWEEWKDTNRQLPVQVFQTERYNEFNLKGKEPKLLTQNDVLADARRIITEVTGQTCPGTIGAIQQAKAERNRPKTKLEILADIEGFGDNPQEMLEEAVMDSVCPGICMNKDCEYTTEVEPDQTQGWCEECNTQTVQSALSLAGVI